MLARDLAEQMPTCDASTTGAQAARLVAEYRVSALVVLNDDQQPYAVLPSHQILSLVVPPYVREDPGLAHAIDEGTSEDMFRRLSSTTLGQLLASRSVRLSKVPHVAPEDTMMEVAAAMISGEHSVVFVIDGHGKFHGVATMSRVLAAVAALTGEDSALVQRRMSHDVTQSERTQPSQRPGVENTPS